MRSTGSARPWSGGRRPASDQIWIWKEIGTLAALVGWGAFVLGLIEALLSLDASAPLRATPEPARGRRSTGWWATLAAGAIIPVLLLFPSFGLGALYLKPSPLFRQGITNQIMVWALLSAGVTLLLGLFRRGSPRDPRLPAQWGLSAALALAVFALGYLCLLAASLLHVDFRFWVVALKPLSARQAGIALVYLIPFTAFFCVILRALSQTLPVRGESRLLSYGFAKLALAGGFLLLLAVGYGTLFGTGKLPAGFDPLTTIVAIQFLPLMSFVAVLATFTWRRTGRWLPAALICGLLVTWYMVAGTATHV